MKPSIAGTFENQILYRMCEDYPRHDDPFVTSGKVLAIGRIYAASPERGSGGGSEKADTLPNAVGKLLRDSELDERLSTISEREMVSRARTFEKVIDLHQWFVDQIAECTQKWNTCPKNPDWKPRNHVSFASKYLHFHKPNAFPIMDTIARAGLNARQFRGASGNYRSFCRDVLRYVEDRGQLNWHPREVDTELLVIGRRALRDDQKIKK